MKKLSYIILILYIFQTITAYADEKTDKTIRIGTGNILQNYYSIGLKLCNFIQKANPGTNCDVLPTEGSVDNLNLLKQGKIDLALIQSDVAWEAYQGKGHFSEDISFKNLLQIFSFHDEIFTVIAKDEDKIKVFADIESKKISNGYPGSGSTITYNALKKYYQFKNEPIDIELNEEEYTSKLCKGEIDAVIMMTGHPNALTSYIAHNCEIDFVSIEQNKIDAFLRDNPAFHEIKLNKGLYHGITEDQKTVASSAILISTNKIDKKLLANFVNYFHKNFTEFKKSNILLQNLKEQDLKKNFILPTSDEFISKG